MSMELTIHALGENAGAGKPKRDVREVAQDIANLIIEEAAELEKAGYTVEPDSIRVESSHGLYDVTMKASR